MAGKSKYSEEQSIGDPKRAATIEKQRLTGLATPAYRASDSFRLDT